MNKITFNGKEQPIEQVEFQYNLILTAIKIAIKDHEMYLNEETEPTEENIKATLEILRKALLSTDKLKGSKK